MIMGPDCLVSVIPLIIEILGEVLRIRIIIKRIKNRRLVPLVSLVRPTFAGHQL